MKLTDVSVQPLSTKSLDRAEYEYDGFVASLGFEQRAWFVAERLSKRARRRFACGFAARKELAYPENRRRFLEAGFKVDDCSEDEFLGWWQDILLGLKDSGSDRLRLCIDVSSMSRFRMGVIALSLLEIVPHREAIVDFVYSIARFSPPPRESAPIEVCAPVVPGFAGWTERPEAPATAIFGLGYEDEKALGAMEYLEPARVWAFQPFGEDQKYDLVQKRANTNFLEQLSRDCLVDYRVDRPFHCFTMLESLIYGNLSDSRVVLVPFGPKIFALSCLIAAAVHWPRVGVWRVSSGQAEPAADRVANGKIVGLRTYFRRAPAKEREES